MSQLLATPARYDIKTIWQSNEGSQLQIEWVRLVYEFTGSFFATKIQKWCKNYKKWPHQQRGALRAPLLPTIFCSFCIIFEFSLQKFTPWIRVADPANFCRGLRMPRKINKAKLHKNDGKTLQTTWFWKLLPADPAKNTQLFWPRTLPFFRGLRILRLK